MIYRTRKLIKPSDLNPRGTLFGGQLLKWIDEEAAILALVSSNISFKTSKAFLLKLSKRASKSSDITD